MTGLVRREAEFLLYQTEDDRTRQTAQDIKKPSGDAA
jgi:hypothetical protein